MQSRCEFFPFEFRIATFGVAKLYQVHDGPDARGIYDAWRPTRGGAPAPIDRTLIVNALANIWGVPDVLCDARCFRPPPHNARDTTSGHCGYSYEMTRKLIHDDSIIFHGMWSDLMANISANVEYGLTPVNIVVYCRAGEKRSVSIAWLLAEALEMHAGGKMVEPIQHLCKRFWGRRTCAAVGCDECTIGWWHRQLVKGLERDTKVLRKVADAPR